MYKIQNTSTSKLYVSMVLEMSGSVAIVVNIDLHAVQSWESRASTFNLMSLQTED